jgi:hypothetical protein
MRAGRRRIIRRFRRFLGLKKRLILLRDDRCDKKSQLTAMLTAMNKRPFKRLDAIRNEP